MNPRRLHSDTIFSINSLTLGSAIGTESVLEQLRRVKGSARVSRAVSDVSSETGERFSKREKRNRRGTAGNALKIFTRIFPLLEFGATPNSPAKHGCYPGGGCERL